MDRHNGLLRRLRRSFPAFEHTGFTAGPFACRLFEAPSPQSSRALGEPHAHGRLLRKTVSPNVVSVIATVIGVEVQEIPIAITTGSI